MLARNAIRLARAPACRAAAFSTRAAGTTAWSTNAKRFAAFGIGATGMALALGGNVVFAAQQEARAFPLLYTTPHRCPRDRARAPSRRGPFTRYTYVAQ